MKSRGAYLGERVVLAVTPYEIAAFDVRVGGFLGTELSWPREDLIVAAIDSVSRSEDPPPAFLIASRCRAWTRLEVQPISSNGVTALLTELDRRRRLKFG
jgi:hypothetical protein